jgi:hypothetical protein
MDWSDFADMMREYAGEFKEPWALHVKQKAATRSNVTPDCEVPLYVRHAVTDCYQPFAAQACLR